MKLQFALIPVLLIPFYATAAEKAAELTAEKAAGEPATKAIPPGAPVEGTGAAQADVLYSRISSSGMVVANEKSWYLEENDVQGRPLRATEWVSGVLTTKTFWEYDGSDPRPLRRTDKTDSSRLVVGFDSSGNISSEIQYDLNDKQVWSRVTERDENGNIVSVTVLSGTTTAKIVNVYSETGTLLEQRSEKNGELVSISRYSSEDDWTETVYKKGVAVFTAIYADGKRVAYSAVKK